MGAAVASLDLKQIRTDGGTQARAVVSEEYVGALALAVNELPPIVVFYDGTTYWLADGFHRVKGHFRAERTQILAEVRQGTRREAVLFSVGANVEHDRSGLRRTNADKRRAVETLLRDEEWGQWSDREIARRCGVDHKTVAAARRELSGEIPQMRAVERQGTQYPMDTSRLSARDFAALPEAEQLAALQAADAEVEAEEQPTAPKRPAPVDDGLRTVTLRRPALIAQLYAGLTAAQVRSVLAAFDQAVKKFGRRAG